MAKLSGASLIDLVQMECLQGTRQTIRVTSPAGCGYLFFDAGQVVHAFFGSKKGEEALHAMLSWRDGTFEVCEIGWPDQKTIHASWQFMLIEHMRRADESAHDSEPPSREVEVDPAPAPEAQTMDPAKPPKALSVPRPQTTQRSTIAARPSPKLPDSPSKLTESADNDATLAMRSTRSLSTSSPGSSAKIQNDGMGSPRYGVVRAVRFEENGQVLSHLGTLEDLTDISSYTLRLARLVGENLGLGEFRGLESRTEERSLFLFLDEETIVAVETTAQANVSAYRHKAGV